MFKKFFNIFLICLCLIVEPTLCFAKKIQTLEEINAELLKKKAALEPFNEKDIKIDLESLGLDDVNNQSKSNEDIKVSQELPSSQTKQETELNLPNLQPILPNNQINKEIKPVQKALPDKITNPIIPVSKSEEKKEENSTKKPQAINSVVKSEEKTQENIDLKQDKTLVKEQKEKLSIDNITNQNIKDNSEKTSTDKIAESDNKQNNGASTSPLANEVKDKDAQKNPENEIEQKPKVKKLTKAQIARKNQEERRQKKLQELREQYLIKINDRTTGDFVKSGDIVVPERKKINPFISEEPPALPIVHNYRTIENSHIPIIVTFQEKVNNLFEAISKDDVAFFNSAYEHVRNPNIRNSLGDTILTYAILLGRYDIMMSIIAKGADVDLPNGLGYRPLEIAVELLDFKSFEILVASNANINYSDSLGKTYLMHCSKVGFLSAVKLLLDKGVDIDKVDINGFSAITVAYQNNRELIVRYLLKRGAKNIREVNFVPNRSLIRDLENRWK